MVVPPLATPTVTHGKFSILGSARINASAETIYNTIVDTSTWPKWSTFVPKVDITSQPSGIDPDSKLLFEGTCMKLRVNMTSTSKSSATERVTPLSPRPIVADPPGTKYEVGWRAEMAPSWVLAAHRINEIVTTDDPFTCEYRSYETMAGFAASIVKLVHGQHLTDRFNDWTRDLKEYCEKLERERGMKIVPDQ